MVGGEGSEEVGVAVEGAEASVGGEGEVLHVLH